MRLKTRDGEEFPVEAFLQSVPWNGGKALLLVLSRAREGASAIRPVAADRRARGARRRDAHDHRHGDRRRGADCRATATIRSISRPAEALFGLDSDEVAGKPFASLFAIESQRAARDYLNGLSDHGVASVLNDGREVIGREAQGRFIPLFMTIGRLPGDSGYCAVVRDITPVEARRGGTDAGARAGRARLLAEDRFPGPRQPRDPHAAQRHHRLFRTDDRREVRAGRPTTATATICATSTARAIMCSTSSTTCSTSPRSRPAQQEMAYEAVSLNDTLAETVAMMQPQANRERVIIRSSFASKLPDVVADLRSVRQIALNILSNAVRYTQAGGQVIVSTAYEASGDVVMRVRDTGIGMTPGRDRAGAEAVQADQLAEARARRRHRARPAADQGDGGGQPRQVLDQLDARRRHAGGGRLPVDAGAGGLSIRLPALPISEPARASNNFP